tara:strand:+ start:614 stop:808 length:195 start_codon:yes stop_codon:yes gene_type:complete
MKDWIWIAGIIAALGMSYGMMSSRVTALESGIKDLELLRLDARLSVIEHELKEINEKVDVIIEK